MRFAYRWLYPRLTELLYTRWAGLYDLVSAIVSMGNWQRWRMGALELTGGGRILELGPGTGHLLSAIAGSGRQGVGAETSPYMAARAARRLRRQGLGPSVVQAYAQALPFGDGCFSCVVSTFPAGYIVESDTQREAARVLDASGTDSPVGRFVISGLWADTSIRLWQLLFFPFYGRPNMRTMYGFAASIQDVGFAPAIVEQVTGNFRVGGIVAIRNNISGRQA